METNLNTPIQHDTHKVKAPIKTSSHTTSSSLPVAMNCLSKGYEGWDASVLEIGMDEVGRGPLFGRVYAAAVVLPKDDSFEHAWMKDSKKFHSKKKIQEVAEYIQEHALYWAVEYEDERKIDEINILQATQQAMHKCVDTVLKKMSKNEEKNPAKLLVDGNYFKPYPMWTKPKIATVMEQSGIHGAIYSQRENKLEYMDFVCVEGGDNKYSSIAAASIIAKVARDKYIEELCQEHPDLIEKYSLDSNKGYGAKKHLDGIKQHGITVWHRRSFGICKDYV